MAIEVVMPRQGNTVESCLIVEWRVSPGDVVAKGDVLCEIETDKSIIEVEAEEVGTIRALLYEEGEDVPVLAPMLILGNAEEDISDIIDKKDMARSNDVESDTSSDGEIGQSATASDGTSVSSSIATLEIKKENTSENLSTMNIAHNQAPGKSVAISPRARIAAETKGVDYQILEGSGPGGRIIERDVLAFADANRVVSRSALTQGPVAGMIGSGIGGRVLSVDVETGTGGITHTSSGLSGGRADFAGDDPVHTEFYRVKPTGIRKVIASRMLESLQTTAQVTLNVSADARSIQSWRKKFKTSEVTLGLQGITLGDMVVFAVSRILPRFPELNAEFKNGTIYRYGDAHLGLAVDTPRGLMVPVIKNANKKSLKQLSDESKALASACLSGSISPDLLNGASFTLSNLGNYGIESFTPVINAPQVAVLGVCSIVLKPVSGAEGVEFVPHMGFSMTIDHQVIDGAPAARFLKEFCSFLAQFEFAAAL